jgi:hypothetical protein
MEVRSSISVFGWNYFLMMLEILSLATPSNSIFLQMFECNHHQTARQVLSLPLKYNRKPLTISSPIHEGHLGSLENFQVKSYEGKASALMCCQGRPHSFRTLIIRGADLVTLAVVKQVLRYGLHALQVIAVAAAVAVAADAGAGVVVQFY